jgi:hypothetical protein
MLNIVYLKTEKNTVFALGYGKRLDEMSTGYIYIRKNCLNGLAPSEVTPGDGATEYGWIGEARHILVASLLRRSSGRHQVNKARAYATLLLVYI